MNCSAVNPVEALPTPSGNRRNENIPNQYLNNLIKLKESLTEVLNLLRNYLITLMDLIINRIS